MFTPGVGGSAVVSNDGETRERADQKEKSIETFCTYMARSRVSGSEAEETAKHLLPIFPLIRHSGCQVYSSLPATYNRQASYYLKKGSAYQGLVGVPRTISRIFPYSGDFMLLLGYDILCRDSTLRTSETKTSGLPFFPRFSNSPFEIHPRIVAAGIPQACSIMAGLSSAFIAATAAASGSAAGDIHHCPRSRSASSSSAAFAGSTARRAFRYRCATCRASSRALRFGLVTLPPCGRSC